MHIFLFMLADSRHVHPDDIDKIISIDIPKATNDPELFKVVAYFMIHGPCGTQNYKSPHMQK